MTLKEKMEEWGNGGETVLCVTHNVDGYKTVYEIKSFDKTVEEPTPICYQLFRYFKLGDNWEVSCDISGGGVVTLEACLNAVTTSFEDIHP